MASILSTLLSSAFLRDQFERLAGGAEDGAATGKDAGKILRLHHLVIVFN